MKVPHTPGHWNPVIYGGWDAPRVFSASGSIALLQHHESSHHEAEANARLIAASPELLEMLYIALPFIEDAKDDPAYKAGRVAQVEARIRAVIIKAGGEL